MVQSSVWKCSGFYRKSAALMLYAGAEGSVGGWVLVQCAKPSQNATTENILISFGTVLYIRTHGILFTYTLFTQTHSYTHKLQVPDTYTVRPSPKQKKKKKGHRAPFSLTPLSDFPVTVQTPPPPVGTVTVHLWCYMSLFSTHSQNGQGRHHVQQIL